MDEWRRFANAQPQEELIAMAEAIVASLKAEEEAGTETDLAATAKALRELQSRWREVADAPHHAAQRLWDRFKAATDFIRSRCEIYFAQLRQEREREPRRQGRAHRAGRNAGQLDRLEQDGRAIPGAAEGLGGHRAGAARRCARSGAALPRRVQRVLHASPRRSRPPRRRSGTRTSHARKPCASARSSWRNRRTGTPSPPS